MSVGDEMVWRHNPRGGWYFICLVPCVVEKIGPKRITIRAQLVSGEWVSRSVKSESLRPKGYVE